MRKLQFYGLPRSLQDRFIESSRGAAVPSPLLVQPFRARDHAPWFAASFGAAVGWASFVAYGFGDLGHPLALAGPGSLLAHAAFAALCVAAALRGQALRWEAQRSPFPPGVYLFPAAVIDARRSEVVEHDASDLKQVSLEGARLRVEFGKGGVFTFDAGRAEVAERAKSSLEAGRDQWSRLQSTDVSLEKARLNPLVDSGVPNPLAPTTPLVRHRFLKPAVFFVVTLVSASMLSWAVWWWRNDLSEKALYRRAVAQNDVAAYDAYLARGGERSEVVDVLLPRARLNAARASGSVEAIRAYIQANPQTKIAIEVQEALRAALLTALERARAAGTVSALTEFAQRYPDHVLVASELGAARQAVYARVLETFEKEASPRNAALVPFVRQLLAYAEVHGPRVDVRMQHKFPQKIETLDNILAKSPKYYMGRRSLPTQYFLGEYAARRERALAERLIERLQKSFPKDVIELGFVGPAEDINLSLPSAEVPTLTISYAENLSGGFVGGRPKTMFLGASIGITATFEIPGQEPPLVFKWGKWMPPNVRKADESEKMVPDSVPDVYEDIASGAFEKFGTEYLQSWFSEP